MWNLHSLQADLIVFSAGVALHILFFRHGEWDLWATKLVGAFLTLQASLLAYLTIFERLKVATSTSAIKTVTLLGTSLVVGIVTSMLVYRKFFHRLHNFPGPTLAPLSNFYATYLSAKKLHLYEETEKLHHEYGDFVRLGLQPRLILDVYLVLTSTARPDGALNHSSKGGNRYLRVIIAMFERPLVQYPPSASFTPND